MEIRLERYKVVQWKSGVVYRTERLYSKWFNLSKAPKCNVVENGELWVATADVRTQR